MPPAATAEVHDHPPPPRFLADRERESQEVIDLTQYLDEWYKENPKISTPPPPPTFFGVNTIKAAIYSHPTVSSAKDLKPIRWISLKPLDFSSRDPFGFDCWVHDVIHGFFWFRLISLYVWFVYILLSIFYCWFFFLINNEERWEIKSNLLDFLVVEWWWLVGLAWISSGGVDWAIVVAVTGDVQCGDGQR